MVVKKEKDAPPEASPEDAPGKAITLTNYVPFLLSKLHNTNARISTLQYSTQFGLGLSEWSCLGLLASESNISATRICEVGGFDRAIVSRSVNALIEKGYVTAKPVANHNRKRLLCMTPQGRQVHDQIMELALAREAKLLTGLDAKEREQLLHTLRTLLRNALDLERSVKKSMRAIRSRQPS